MGPELRELDAGLVEGDLDPGVPRDVGRGVTGQGGRDPQRPGGLDGPRRLGRPVRPEQLEAVDLAAAERCGLQQPEKLYADVLKWTFTMQEKEGPEMPRWDPTLKEEDKVYGVGKDHARGFGYAGTDATERDTMVSSSMTACGLANIVICTTFLEARESPLYTGELAQKAEKAWWDGVAWLDMHWTVTENANRGNYHYYYLYCLERACDLKGINLIAGHPWYNLGAQVLVDQQGSRGQWDKEDTHRPSNILNTCFALLFLNRATPAITGD